MCHKELCVMNYEMCVMKYRHFYDAISNFYYRSKANNKLYRNSPNQGLFTVLIQIKAENGPYFVTQLFTVKRLRYDRLIMMTFDPPTVYFTLLKEFKVSIFL